MPLLGFQKQFAPLVESGEKRQTIRAYRKDGRDPKPGQTLYLYTGLRTPLARKLGEARCSSTQPIEIYSDGAVWARDGTDHETIRSLAKADGFAGTREMLDWFEKTHGLPFEGLLIRWGDITPPDDSEST